MTFPTVSGSNLLREKFTLPRDFQGRFNLVFIAFEQWQQKEVDSWMAMAKELEEQFDGLVYYELPTIQSRNTLYRMFIDEGMRAGIPNPKTRERTITLYLDKTDFRAIWKCRMKSTSMYCWWTAKGKSYSAPAAHIAARER